MIFPLLVYRCPGPHLKPGQGTYDYAQVKTQDELDAKLTSGWFTTFIEAKEAAGEIALSKKPLKKSARRLKPSRPLDGVNRRLMPKPTEQIQESVEEPSDDQPVTRAELVTKATELGLTFSKRTSDEKLLAMITDALSKQEA